MFNNLTEYQQKVLDYLMVTPERRLALSDLLGEHRFLPRQTDDALKAHLNVYLDKNPRNFCKGGIERAKKALDLEPPVPLQVGDVVVSRAGHDYTVVGMAGSTVGLGRTLPTGNYVCGTFTLSGVEKWERKPVPFQFQVGDEITGGPLYVTATVGQVGIDLITTRKGNHWRVDSLDQCTIYRNGVQVRGPVK